MIISSNAPSSPDTVNVTGFGATYTLSIAKKSIALGSVKVGTSKDTVITLTNSGNDTLRISGIISSRTAFISTLASAAVAPGGAAMDTIRFIPSQPGSDTARIVIVSNASSSPDSIVVTGFGATYGVSLTGKSIAMGIVRVGSHKDTVITLANAGNDTLKITGVSSTRATFVSRLNAATVPPNGSVIDTIRFSPSQAGTDSARIVILSNAVSSPDTIAIQGFGANYGIAFNSTNRITLGSVKINSRKDTLITISNTGNQPVSITGITSSSSVFTVSPSQFTISIGGSIQDTIRYTPIAVRSDSARIIITSNAQSSPDTIIVYASGTLTGVVTEPGIPTVFTLNQNYPNPFNPSTTLRYGLPSRSRVRLIVYDILGRIVADLVNAEVAPGWNQVVWNANVASGLYFYRIEAISVSDPNRRFVDVRKMLLLK
ncbi:MAG: choice-of-anchor D domain-containing protein [Methanothrix sp.]|nr:choice-of-anchor D domain-containing protein [Methanothrix sp.]